MTFLILIEVLNLNKSQFLNDRLQSEIEELIKQDKKQPVSTALANKQRKHEENSQFNSVLPKFFKKIVEYKGYEKHSQFQF